MVRTENGATYERRQWKVKEITDVKALAQAMIDGRVPDNVLLPNLSALNSLVKAGLRDIPGVVVYEEVSIVTRT
jgi:hypothetical protein